ncbi:MAG: hypothetical protein H6851_05265 [Geminicoccaceae bacterium]|nr:hypothetical protein [Geminicoccaceae bacterium]
MTGLARRGFMRLGALLPAALASPPVAAREDPEDDQQALRVMMEINGLPTRLCLPLPAPGRAITWTNENERLRGHPGARHEMLFLNFKKPVRGRFHKPFPRLHLHLHLHLQQQQRIQQQKRKRTCDG